MPQPGCGKRWGCPRSVVLTGLGTLITALHGKIDHSPAT